MVRYLRAFEDPLADKTVRVGIYDDPDKAGYLTPAVLAAAKAALDAAEAAVPAGPYRDRVDEAGLGLREIDLDSTIPPAGASPADRAAYRKRFNAFVADLHRFGVTAIAEGYSTEAYVADRDKAIGDDPTHAQAPVSGALDRL